MNCWPFKRKTRPIHLDFYTERPGVFGISQPLEARKFLPDWWRAIPTSIENQSKPLLTHTTMKKCAGFVDLYRYGFIVPLWSDVNIHIGKKGTTAYSYQFSDLASRIDMHPAHQRGSYLPETEWQHLKISVPWVVRCSEEIPFHYRGVEYNLETPNQWVTAPGVVEYKYQQSLHINLLFPRKDEDYTVHIPAGTPMAHVIPLSERPLELEHHLVTPHEFSVMADGHHIPSFIGSYLRWRDLAKRQEANKKSDGKCPFSSIIKGK